MHVTPELVVKIEFDFQHLASILREYSRGREVLEYYKTNKSLDHYNRGLLAHVIIDEELKTDFDKRLTSFTVINLQCNFSWQLLINHFFLNFIISELLLQDLRHWHNQLLKHSQLNHW